ncbi:hypothetical protein V2J09_010098 [Rumex salicifolius]
MMQGGNGTLSVPPGFRFHPTDEELLYYYLKKKVSYEAIDLDVIREIDLNKLEPWDLREKCRIGTGPQSDWYFFSHKDKKYPTGTRTNRATTAGFWKATGRDKPIFFSNAKKIGMRKTLVFYTGRAPHVFKKKNHISRGFQVAPDNEEEGQEDYTHQARSSLGNGIIMSHNTQMAKQHSFHQQSIYGGYPFDGSMNLPHLSSPDLTLAQQVSQLPPATSAFLAPISLSNIDLECSQNLLRLTSGGPTLTQPGPAHQKFGGDWLFLDKLLTNYKAMDHQNIVNHHHVPPLNLVDHMDAAAHQKFPFQYLGCEPDMIKYSKNKRDHMVRNFKRTKLQAYY